MKRIYILSTLILFGICPVCFSQNELSEELIASNTEIETVEETTFEKQAPNNLQVIRLLEELQTILEASFNSDNHLVSLQLSIGNASDGVTINLRDSEGNVMIDSKLGPNTTRTIEINENGTTKLLLQITDMQTLKSTVYSISLD
jgi:small ligand-binding sensory domain FIST